jgi:hypothetical protein
MKLFSALVVFVLLLIGDATTSHAKDRQPHLAVSEPVDHRIPVPGANYAISVTCEKSADIKGLVDVSFFEKLIVTKKITISHMIFLSRDFPTVTSSVVDLPKSPLALINVFSTDGQTEFDGFKLCNQTFLMSGNQRVYIVPIINYSKKLSNGLMFGIVDSVTKILTPLSPLLGGIVPVAALTGLNNSVQQAKAPMETLLGTLNAGDNKAAPVRLFLGTTVIKTRVGRVTLKVEPVPSLVEDPDRRFLTDLQSQLSQIVTKPQSGSGLSKTCSSIAVGLAQSGITSLSDIAYSLVYLASKEVGSEDELLTCLVEKGYANAAANLDKSLFAGYPSFEQLTQQAVDNFFVGLDQPSYGQIERKLDDLISYLPQYTRTVPHPQTAAGHLQELFAPNIIIQDKTSGPVGNFDESQINALKAIDTLADLGMLRFGCYAPTSIATGRNLDGAVAMFLMFKADAAARKTTIENTFAVRPIFDAEFRIAKLVLSDRMDWIKAALDARGGNCNGFSVVMSGP